MGINIRTKGQSGEREIADDLNLIVYMIYKAHGVPYPEKDRIQRNQNQSAVGGCDLTGTFELAIEIKRQETLSINTWWAQCVKSAKELEQTPVLIFRQNTPAGGRKLWRVILLVELPVPGVGASQVRAEITYEDFKEWFRIWATEHLKGEWQIGTVPTEPKKPEKLPEIREELPEIPQTRVHFPDLFAETA